MFNVLMYILYYKNVSSYDFNDYNDYLCVETYKNKNVIRKYK